MFMRLVTPVDAEPAVWVDLMIKHGWRKAIILVADDHNGNSVYEAAVNQATQKNVQVLSSCIFFLHFFPWKFDISQLNFFWQAIKEQSELNKFSDQPEKMSLKTVLKLCITKHDIHWGTSKLHTAWFVLSKQNCINPWK